MEKLIQGLRNFQSSYFCSHQELFEELSHGQKPRVLFIACSDSRVDPNLITQSEVGELFVIRNAGNIVPPYGATNGGEGASIEYAIQALDINQVIICGHSYCGAMKGLLKLESLRDSMPLVCNWLSHAEATRQLIKESYGDYKGDDLLDITIAENVLTQLENLRTYPIVHARLSQKKLSLHAWVYHIENGVVMSYDPDRHGFIALNQQLPTCDIGTISAATYPEAVTSSWLPSDQANRIYRGSFARS